jgi:AAA domain, putative AbiEii toxin, Type IV TA system
VVRDGEILLDRPNKDDNSDPARLSQTFLEQVNVNRDFRTIADFLKNIRYRHIVPQLIREPDRSVGKVDDPFGGDFLEQIAKTSNRSREAMLERVRKALQVAVPQLQALEMHQDAKGVYRLRGKYEHWRPHGAWQSESDFSDGTLRLLGLLWAVLDGKGTLLLEEPELSLHPEVVRYIPPMLTRMQTRTGRQIVASTQSTELLQDPGIGLNEVFLLLPGPEGTKVRSAASLDEVRALLEGGLSMGEAVMPRTRPRDPDSLPDAKRVVTDIARHSSDRRIREEMVSRPVSGRKVGPAYVARMIEFIELVWMPDDAGIRSESLSRCLGRLRLL